MIITFRDCDENGKNGNFLGIFHDLELARRRCVGYKNVYYREVYEEDMIYEDDPLKRLYSKVVKTRVFPVMWTKDFERLPDSNESFKKAKYFMFTERKQIIWFFYPSNQNKIPVNSREVLAHLDFSKEDRYFFYINEKEEFCPLPSSIRSLLNF